VFYIGKHMFHVLFPDASVTEDNVAVSTMAQSTVMPQSSTSLPLAPPPLPVPTSMPAPSLQQPHHIQPNQPLHSAANAASTTSVMSQPLARSSSHVRYVHFMFFFLHSIALIFFFFLEID
jgi:hypothetical protein